MSGKPYTRGRHAADDQPVWLYGRHAVRAALGNSARRARRLVATRNAAQWLAEGEGPSPAPEGLEDLKPHQIDALLPEGAVHQGLAGLFTPLPRARLKDVCDGSDARPVLVLDQVTDPQNIGAAIRAAAAFGAQALIVQERRTPPLAGALAKAAVGTLEVLPVVKLVNISRALEALAEMGFRTMGLAGEAEAALPDVDFDDRPLALVLGAEGAGLREGVKGNCQELVRIPLQEGVESLNVSTAAAVALYAISHAKGR